VICKVGKFPRKYLKISGTKTMASLSSRDSFISFRDFTFLIIFQQNLAPAADAALPEGWPDKMRQ